MAKESHIKFDQMKRYYFDHNTTEKFIDFLITKGKVIAPHKRGENSFSYQEVSDPSKVVFEYPRTIQPLKKFFIPPSETLLTFNSETNEYHQNAVVSEKLIFFAVHSYEMQAIHRLDFNFSRGNPESNYLNRRQNSIFIGISFTPDEWHFSKAVGIEIEKVEGFSLFFEPVENGFLVFEVNESGKELLSEFDSGFLVDAPLDIVIKEKNFQEKIKYHYNRIPQVFEYVYHSTVWSEVAQKCLGCGTCNLLCPTCFCFDVRDEVGLDLKQGKRERYWDGCMLNEFAEVAGGENFRNTLSSRTRHRLYRKFKYITQLSGELHCVGCGRCSRYCPAGIDIVAILNELIKDYQRQQETSTV
jgi:sulfhydrogenase subunit beta (sulfur reductase)